MTTMTPTSTRMTLFQRPPIVSVDERHCGIMEQIWFQVKSFFTPPTRQLHLSHSLVHFKCTTFPQKVLLWKRTCKFCIGLTRHKLVNLCWMTSSSTIAKFRAGKCHQAVGTTETFSLSSSPTMLLFMTWTTMLPEIPTTTGSASFWLSGRHRTPSGWWTWQANTI